MTIRTLQLYHTARRKIKSSVPTLVFTATFMLMIVSISGTVVALSISNVQDPKASVGASQSLTLLSSAVSFIFIGLYLLAVRRDEPVSKARPPTLPVHGACFITLRITTLLWAAALVVALATTSNKQPFQENTTICKLQRVDMVLSLLAMYCPYCHYYRGSTKKMASLAAIVIMMGLESCERPFKIPCAFIFQPQIVCRVSYFDELLEHSVSRRPSYECSRRLGYRGSVRSMQSGMILHEKVSTSDASTPLSKHLSCTTTLLEDSQVLRGYAVGSKRVTQSSRQDLRERIPRQIRSYSRYLSQPGRCITLTSMSSQFGKSPESLGGAGPSEASGSPSRASPTSSISMASHRSPLSTVRSVENPEVPVNTELYICPLLFPHAVDGSGMSPVPVENITILRRRASKGAREIDLRKYIVQGKSKNKDTVAKCHTIHHPAPNPANCRLEVTNSPSQLSTLDGHSKIIEDRIFAAVLRRLQEEQRLRDEAIQQQIAIAEFGYLRYLESRRNKSQECEETVSTVEPLNGSVPVLPELDLDLEVISMED